MHVGYRRLRFFHYSEMPLHIVETLILILLGGPEFYQQ